MGTVPVDCPDCHASLDADQRYCLACGRRVGPLRLDWRALLSRGSSSAPSPSRQPATAGGLALPTPRVAASLLLVLMGFGVVVAGAVTGDAPRALAAAPRGTITLVLPPREPAPAALAQEPDPPPPPQAPAPMPPPPVAPAAAPQPASPPPNPIPEEEDKELITAPDDEEQGPTIRHVFLVSLGPGTREQWFGESSPVPYLARELAPQGTLLSGYRATSAGELANQMTLISGLPANPQTEANCPIYSKFDGTEGCLQPPDAYTLPDQLAARGNTWKAYVEGQDAPGAEPPACRRPEAGSADPYHAPGRPGDPYVTWRNPFVYFETITASPDCAGNDVGLGALEADLADPKRTASFSWIAPAPENAGPAGADAWLRAVLPRILESEAFQESGLLLLVPDASGVAEDPVTGALLLSPDHVTPGVVDTTAYDHLSTLKTVEELFSLRYLGGAQDDAVESFASRLLH